MPTELNRAELQHWGYFWYNYNHYLLFSPPPFSIFFSSSPPPLWNPKAVSFHLEIIWEYKPEMKIVTNQIRDILPPSLRARLFINRYNHPSIYRQRVQQPFQMDICLLKMTKKIIKTQLSLTLVIFPPYAPCFLKSNKLPQFHTNIRGPEHWLAWIYLAVKTDVEHFL